MRNLCLLLALGLMVCGAVASAPQPLSPTEAALLRVQKAAAHAPQHLRDMGSNEDSDSDSETETAQDLDTDTEDAGEMSDWSDDESGTSGTDVDSDDEGQSGVKRDDDDEWEERRAWLFGAGGVAIGIFIAVIANLFIRRALRSSGQTPVLSAPLAEPVQASFQPPVQYVYPPAAIKPGQNASLPGTHWQSEFVYPVAPEAPKSLFNA